MTVWQGLGSCPVPTPPGDLVTLGHGSGGRLTSDLVTGVFLDGYGGQDPARLEDQAFLPTPPSGHRLAFTTDSFVVRPLFFRGGDIGRLAVCGTVNDLAVGGATPKYLSAAFIIEEGLPLADLRRIVASMRSAAAEASVELVTGDTKVVDRGKGDGVFITTAGIGIVPPGVSLSIAAARPGDRIVISGTIGDHGIGVLSEREGLEFETELRSDVAPVHQLAARVLEVCPATRCMRDPTRGGVSATLHELATASGVGVCLKEDSLPLRREVRAACEMLGLDPIHVANEGKLIAVVPSEDADRVLGALRDHPLGRDAADIGAVVADHPGIVTQRSLIGIEIVVSLPEGEQLPRIC